MTSSSPKVATTSARSTPPPLRSVVANDTGSRPNIRFATTAPRQPPSIWAATRAAAVGVSTSPNARSTRVTTGLKAADTGWRARIRATRAAPVAMLFSSSCSPTSPGDKRLAAMPEPITAMTRNAVPRSSAAARRATVTRP